MQSCQISRKSLHKRRTAFTINIPTNNLFFPNPREMNEFFPFFTAYFEHVLEFQLGVPFQVPISGEPQGRLLDYLCHRPCQNRLLCSLTDEARGAYLQNEMEFDPMSWQLTFTRRNLGAGFAQGVSHYAKLPEDLYEEWGGDQNDGAELGSEIEEGLEREIWD